METTPTIARSALLELPVELLTTIIEYAVLPCDARAAAYGADEHDTDPSKLFSVVGHGKCHSTQQELQTDATCRNCLLFTPSCINITTLGKEHRTLAPPQKYTNILLVCPQIYHLARQALDRNVEIFSSCFALEEHRCKNASIVCCYPRRNHESEPCFMTVKTEDVLYNFSQQIRGSDIGSRIRHLTIAFVSWVRMTSSIRKYPQTVKKNLPALQRFTAMVEMPIVATDFKFTQGEYMLISPPRHKNCFSDLCVEYRVTHTTGTTRRQI
jgi:hypothetical protein